MKDAGTAVPGTILSLEGGMLRIKTGMGPLDITQLQPEGKKRMNTADYLRGARLRIGDRLGSIQGGEQ